jgi:hypothetical protein
MTLAAVLAVGCAGSGAAEEAGAELELTRSDGSTIRAPKRVLAWCRPPEGQSVDAPDELQVLGGEFPAEHDPKTYWFFSRKAASIEEQPTLELPDDTAGDAAFFLFDSEKRNELSSAVEDAKGSITVVDWGCDHGDDVRIEVAAVLGSELHGLPTARVNGRIRAVIGNPIVGTD